MVVTGWLRPNASAARPVRSTPSLERHVEAPVSRRAADRHGGRGHRRRPDGRLERNVELAAVPADLVDAIAWRPSWTPVPVTMSSAPPVAVSKAQMPAPTFVFGLPPTVSRMYGAPNGRRRPPGAGSCSRRRPMISVSRSVYGAVVIPGGVGQEQRAGGRLPPGRRSRRTASRPTPRASSSRSRRRPSRCCRAGCDCAAATFAPPKVRLLREVRRRQSWVDRRRDRDGDRDEPMASSPWLDDDRALVHPVGVPVGTRIVASNEPLAERGVVSQPSPRSRRSRPDREVGDGDRRRLRWGG